MTEERHRLIDAAVKILTVIVFLVGVPLGIYKYTDTQQQGFRAKEWDTRLKHYVELSRHVAAIASADSYDEAKEHIIPFKTTYYGPVSILMNKDVMEAMTPFAGTVFNMNKNNFKELNETMPAQLDSITDALRLHLYSTKTIVKIK